MRNVISGFIGNYTNAEFLSGSCRRINRGQIVGKKEHDGVNCRMRLVASEPEELTVNSTELNGGAWTRQSINNQAVKAFKLHIQCWI